MAMMVTIRMACTSSVRSALALQIGTFAQKVARCLQRQVRDTRQHNGRNDGLGDVVHRAQLQAWHSSSMSARAVRKNHGDVARDAYRL